VFGPKNVDGALIDEDKMNESWALNKVVYLFHHLMRPAIMNTIAGITLSYPEEHMVSDE